MTLKYKISLLFLLFLRLFPVNAQQVKPVWSGKFIEENGLIILPVTVNGDTLHLFFDTGSRPVVLFSPGTGTRTDTAGMKKIFIRSIGNKRLIPAYRSDDNTVQLGPIRQQNVPLLVLKKNFIDAESFFKTKIDGLIGTEFFKNYVVKIDFFRKRFKIYPRKPAIPKRFKQTPLRFINGIPNIRFEVSGRKTVLALDTGNNDYLWLFNLPETERYKKVRLRIGRSITGDIEGWRTLADSIGPDDKTLDGVPVSVPDTSLLEDINRIYHARGILGTAWLRNYRFFIDFRHKKLYYRKPWWHKFRIVYDKSGIVLQYSTPRWIAYEKIIPAETGGPVPGLSEKPDLIPLRKVTRFRYSRLAKITEIIPGTPADKAGLRKGDLILKINGHFVFQFKNLAEINTILGGKEGKIIFLDVLRNEKQMRFRFRLKDYFKK